MAQNLPAPCYQVYAANTLADLSFRQADLATRGLIYTLQLECWVNRRLPSNPATLARVLGIDAIEVAAALPVAMAHFKIDGESIISPQLEDYRKHLDEIRLKQREGGKKGAEITNKKKHSDKRTDIGLEGISANPQVDPQVSSIEKQNTVKQSKTQSLEREVISFANSVTKDPWLVEYEANENCSAEDYLAATRG